MSARDAVEQLGARIGFGRLMQLAEEVWGERLNAQGLPPGARFAVGPCAGFMVPCTHPVLDQHGHCEVCCGSGRVTKWVAAMSTTAPAASREEGKL
ncbi:hypothetical protein [Roseomonas chloroacetimidivorans]|uniref:hypothetical protein n=1 Tax=Roseomonas chloroacetimidivorans TaxID=1766656 RepID=UPI003C789FEB